MGLPTKIQLIQRKNSQQWYINFPSAIAQAMEFTKGETVEWIIEDRNQLLVRRAAPRPSGLKKKRQACWRRLTICGARARPRAGSPRCAPARGAWPWGRCCV